MSHNYDQFIYENPWFDMCLENRIKRNVRIQLQNIFPELFRQQVQDSATFNRIKHDMQEVSDREINKITACARGELKNVLNQVEDTVKQNISAFSDTTFSHLEEQIKREQSDRFAKFQNGLTKEHEFKEQNRWHTIKNLSKDRDDLLERVGMLERKHSYLRFGLGILSSGFLFYVLSK